MKLRNDSVEPSNTKSKTLSEDPSLVIPYTAIFEPNRAKLRILNAEPMLVLSMIDTFPAKRPISVLTLKALPHLTIPLIESEEPKLANWKMLKCEPMEAMERTDIVEPKLTKLSTLKPPVISACLVTLRFDEQRAIPLSESVEPNDVYESTLKALPMRT